MKKSEILAHRWCSHATAILLIQNQALDPRMLVARATPRLQKDQATKVMILEALVLVV